MIYKWLLTNNENINSNNLELIQASSEFNFFCEKQLSSFRLGEQEVKFLIDGYIVPRVQDYQDYLGLTQEELLAELFRKYDLGFIKHIKGQYNLVLIVGDCFHIFTDWIGIKKTFYYDSNEEFFFSNTLKLISQNIKAEFDRQNILIYTLMYHFVDGQTFLKNVKFTEPAAQISFKNKLKFDTYWAFDELAKLEARDVPFEEIADIYQNSLKSYIDFLKPKGICASLTGGSDTRVTLAGLLSIGVKPHLYTFGHPDSYDAVLAKKISAEFGLEHNLYNFPEVTPEWFDKGVKEIIPLGNSITSIHRVHRLESIKKESKNGEMLLLGSLGGEIIKGEFLNDYILTELVRRWWGGNEDKKVVISDILDRHFVNKEIVDIDKLYNYFSKQKYFSNEMETCQFNAVFQIVARLHDPQDMYLFYNHLNYVVPTFLDIDYLNIVFESKYNLFHKKFTNSNNPLRRLDNPFYQANLLNTLYPRLTEIEMAGYYSHKEYLQNKYLCIVKKVFREKFSGRKYTNNFNLGPWFTEYVKNSISGINSDLVNEIFDLEKMKRTFQGSEHQLVEKYWTKYSQIINLDLLSKEFLS